MPALGPFSIQMREGACVFLVDWKPPSELPREAEFLLLADAAFRHALRAAYPLAPPPTSVQKSVNLLGAWTGGPLRVEARLLKAGRRLAVGEATLSAAQVVAHVSATYLVTLSKSGFDIS